MIWRAEGRRRIIFDSDDHYVDDKNPLFVQINGDPICAVSLYIAPTKKKGDKSGGTETQYLLKVYYKFFWKNNKHVCSDCEDTDL